MANTITLPKSATVAPIAIKRPRLRLLYTPTEGIVKNRVFSLLERQTWLGRELPPEHPGIIIAGDAGMSGVHALIEVSHDDEQVKIADWRSKNGTYLGRSRLTEPQKWHLMEDGDLIRAGDTFFLLRFELSQTADAEIPSLIGVSSAMRELRFRIARMAPHSASVLLLGETGTGKEVAANALHELSRRPGELVTLNSPAIPSSLAESELFGHTEGSFTGAHARQGAFRRANRGTLFLDEIGDLAPEVQSKLLRVMEERVVTPVGGDRATQLDVRIIAATNKDLYLAAESDVFRSDLYARLAQLQLNLPPLRERREDILPLLLGVKPDGTVPLTPDLVQDLLLYDWPRNVRELTGIKKRLLIEGITESLIQDLRRRSASAKEEASPEQSPPSSKETMSNQCKTESRPYRYPVPSKDQLEGLMQNHQGSVKRVAEGFKVDRKTVNNWLNQYNLDPDDFRKLPK